jgi:general secretion pathway protein M
MKLRTYFDNLAERERRLLFVFFGILGFLVLVFVPVLVRMGVNDRAAQNERLEAVIQSISTERVTIAKRQAQAGRLEQRYGTQAPPLAGWLAKVADEVGVEIPETQDRSTVPRGKTFKERSTHIRLSKVGMYNLSTFMERVSASNYPVVISRLDIKKRSGKPDEYDAELDITAFDREEKKMVKKPAPKPAAAEEDEAEEDAVGRERQVKE